MPVRRAWPPRRMELYYRPRGCGKALPRCQGHAAGRGGDSSSWPCWCEVRFVPTTLPGQSVASAARQGPLLLQPLLALRDQCSRCGTRAAFTGRGDAGLPVTGLGVQEAGTVARSPSRGSGCTMAPLCLCTRCRFFRPSQPSLDPFPVPCQVPGPSFLPSSPKAAFSSLLFPFAAVPFAGARLQQARARVSHPAQAGDSPR